VCVLKKKHTHTHTQQKTDSGWFHIDQNPQQKPNFECIQGLVNLLPVTPTTGGNVLVSKSHLYFPHHYTSSSSSSSSSSSHCHHDCSDFYETRLQELNGDDWLEIDPNDTLLLQPENVVSCLLHPGDLLLWDSRVVHCSYPGRNQPDDDDDDDGTCCDTKKHNLIRAATLVSMMPSQTIPPPILQLRKDATFQYRTLTHWSDKCSPRNECVKEVWKEQFRVDWMLKWQQLEGGKEDGDGVNYNDDENSCGEDSAVINKWKKQRKVLLDYNDLSEQQKLLVTGGKI